MFKDGTVDLTYYNPFSKLFTFKEWAKVLIFYLLVILMYLYALQAYVNNSYSYSGPYDPNFINTFLIMTLLEFSTIIILPLFYITYIVGRESRLVSSVRFSFAFIKLCMLYTMILLLFLPEIYMYYLIFVVNYAYIFAGSNNLFQYYLIGAYAVKFAYAYVIVLIFMISLYSISLYRNKRHKKVIHKDLKSTSVNISQSNQSVVTTSNINDIDLNTKKLAQEFLTKEYPLSDYGTPTTKMFDEGPQLITNEEAGRPLSYEVTARRKGYTFDLDYLTKTYFNKQEWITFLKVYYLVLLFDLILTFGLTLLVLLSPITNNPRNSFFGWENSLVFITVSINFVIPKIYGIQNHQKKAIPGKVVLWKVIFLYIFAIIIFSITNEFNNELYQIDAFNDLVLHCLVLVVIWGLIGGIVFGTIYRKKIDVTLNQYEAYTQFKTKCNLNYLLYYKKTKNSLLSSDLVDSLIKQFFLLQTNEIRSILPTLTPLNLRVHLKNIIEQDYDRLKKLCQYNGIEIKSDKALVDFAMTIAEPLVFCLEPVLRSQFTSQLLNKNTDLKLLHANADDLWLNINKILLQWKSSLDEPFKIHI